MSAILNSVSLLPDGRWMVVVSVRPGVRVATVLQDGPPPPALVDELLREAQSRPGLARMPAPPAGS